MKVLKIKNRAGQEFEVLVDAEDWDRVSQFKWSVTNGYVVRRAMVDGKNKTTRLHRHILNYDGPLDVDHINTDRLDNRKSNLRVCSRSQNKMNSKAHIDNLSGLKGVSFDKNAKRYYARIRLNGKAKCLGYYISAIDAAKAYDQAAIIHHGQFARLNFPIVLNQPIEAAKLLNNDSFHETGTTTNNILSSS